MHRHPTRARTLLAGLAAGACLAGAAVPAAAQESRESRLERRVEELERLVKQLLEQRAGAPVAAVPPAAPTPAAAAGPAPLQAASLVPNAAPGTRFLYTGFVKADALWTDAADGSIPENTAGRDFYVPSATPVGGPSKPANLDAHVKQTRLILGTDTPLGGKDVLQARVEVDLFGSSLGDQRTTNTYGVQVRHAYVQWREWLVGQTWSNFEDVAALPEAVDFIGTTDGTVFVRQPQVRWTRGGLSLSAENTETTLTPFRATTQNARTTSDDSNVPDLVAKYTWKGGWGHLSAAVLGRQLKYRAFGPAGTTLVDDTAYTAAASLSGKLMLGRDDLRIVLLGGNLGRYVGLNFANDAAITTNGVAAVGRLDAIEGWAAALAYRHLWTPALRTNAWVSLQRYDNDVAFTGALANESSRSWAVNLIWTPLPKLDLGAEFRHATRELESGVDGSLSRVQFTTKYSF